MALFINDKFKIWLKPTTDENMYTYDYTFKKFDNKNTYKLVQYVNGTKLKEYNIKSFEVESVEIANILYNGVNLQYDKHCTNNDVNGICWINIECLKELYLNNKIKLNYHARNCLYKFFNISKRF